ncbi:hypothetical protein MHEI_05510 [Mycobacterium heidelbergense]|nr:hypothetical protein MHEI_05510 [Mycobacterium heidelbergense]
MLFAHERLSKVPQAYNFFAFGVRFPQSMVKIGGLTVVEW